MRAQGRIFTFLAADHDRLERLMAEAVTPHGTIAGVAYAQFREGLLRHIGMEEKVLFPASRKGNGGIALPMIASLHEDHGALALLLVPTPDPSILDEIRSILDRHNALEEGPEGIYAACDRLSEAEIDHVIERLRRFPPVKVARHRDGPAMARTAEEAYRTVRRQRPEAATTVSRAPERERSS
ncbi:MAG TPA: hemerythrin domain-containing protein [Candidatus Sulfotelmatobacter sp.]|nr:hemerythrin domain-containing protein [Candidatus Sulfotelmatobacter sp.]